MPRTVPVRAELLPLHGAGHRPLRPDRAASWMGAKRIARCGPGIPAATTRSVEHPARPSPGIPRRTPPGADRPGLRAVHRPVRAGRGGHARPGPEPERRPPPCRDPPRRSAPRACAHRGAVRLAASRAPQHPAPRQWPVHRRWPPPHQSRSCRALAVADAAPCHPSHRPRADTRADAGRRAWPRVRRHAQSRRATPHPNLCPAIPRRDPISLGLGLHARVPGPVHGPRGPLQPVRGYRHRDRRR